MGDVLLGHHTVDRDAGGGLDGPGSRHGIPGSATGLPGVLAQPILPGVRHRHADVTGGPVRVGPYCVDADDAVRELQRKGVRARRLVDGFPEWSASKGAFSIALSR